MATKKNSAPKKRPPFKKLEYTVTFTTNDLQLARAIATIVKQTCSNTTSPIVAAFDAPFPGCGGPGDPC